MKKHLLLLATLAMMGCHHFPVHAQVGVVPFRSSRATFTDTNGVPLAGGCIYTYLGGTSTPQATYTDYTGGTSNPDPVILDSSGSAVMWLGPNTYKFIAWSYGGTNCATGALQWTVDQIPGDAFLNGTISGATITNPTINGGTQAGTAISGVTITGSNIQSTPIGGTTPAAGSFTSIVGAVNNMSFSGTPVFNAGLYSTFSLTLTGNVASSTIIGGTAGQQIVLNICQDGTGGHTFVWPSNFTGYFPQVNPSAGVCTIINAFLNASSNWQVLYTSPILVIGNYQSVTFTSAPTFNANTYSSFAMTLTANVTSGAGGIVQGSNGQFIGLNICEDGTGGYTFVWPNNLSGAPPIDVAPNACTGVIAGYSSGSSTWYVVSQSISWLAPNPNTPTIANGSGVTASLISGSNDGAGVVDVTVGAAGAGTLFTLNFGGSYSQAMFCVISPYGFSGTVTMSVLSGYSTNFIVQAVGGASGTGYVNYLCHH